MSEVVGDGEVGRVLNFDDAANPLAQALRDLTDQPARWEAMGRRAREHATARYSTQAMAEAVQAVYSELLTPKPYG
jgi:glycosyltransferase involved in cell wall biosynthesis